MAAADLQVDYRIHAARNSLQIIHENLSAAELVKIWFNSVTLIPNLTWIILSFKFS